MNKQQTFLQFLSNPNAPVALDHFVLHLALAGLLAYLLALVYTRFGHSLSNRRLFARNFVLITMTTMLIITIVKSSLALSLGLVGALSIIRFRAAIKEPEELTYLFLAISMGLGLGAGQALVTIVAFAVIAAVLWAKHLVHPPASPPNLYLTVTTPAPPRVSLPQILETLNQCCSATSLKRFDETPELMEASFHVAFANMAKLDECNRRLRTLGEGVRLSYLEDRGIGA